MRTEIYKLFSVRRDGNLQLNFAGKTVKARTENSQNTIPLFSYTTPTLRFSTVTVVFRVMVSVTVRVRGGSKGGATGPCPPPKPWMKN